MIIRIFSDRVAEIALDDFEFVADAMDLARALLARGVTAAKIVKSKPGGFQRMTPSELKRIQNFTAKCRRLWPGATVTLRSNVTADAAPQVQRGSTSETRHPATKGDIPMADEFIEHGLDLETPTEADLDQAYGGRFLQASDIGDKKIRTKILRIRKEEMVDRETGKKKVRFVAFFENIDKGMILNATNKNVLVDALGKPPANWICASVGVFVDPNVTYGNKRTGGLRLRALLPPAAAPKPTAAPAPKPTPQPVAVERPNEKDDPGFDQDLIDSEQDFESIT